VQRRKTRVRTEDQHRPTVSTSSIYESDVAGKPIQLRDDELGLEPLASCERLCQFRPVAALAALHLDKLLGERLLAAVQVVEQGLSLCRFAVWYRPLSVHPV
jgi:hypothetical protein